MSETPTPALARRSLATVRKELRLLQKEEAQLVAQANTNKQQKLERALARLGFGLAAGVVGQAGKFIASHPTLGQVSADDPDKLLLRARGRTAEQALREGAA